MMKRTARAKMQGKVQDSSERDFDSVLGVFLRRRVANEAEMSPARIVNPMTRLTRGMKSNVVVRPKIEPLANTEAEWKRLLP